MNLRPALLCCLALGACKRPGLPQPLTPVTLTGAEGRSFELQREIDGVGPVTERVLSRTPAQVRDGACAGQLELDVPGAPGGAQRYNASVGCPSGAPRIVATRRDAVSGRTFQYEPTLDQMMQARSLVLQDRDDGGRWFLRDALHDARSWVGVAHAVGHAHLEPAADRVPQLARQLVLVTGMYSGFPTAGAQWDDVQVALVDGDGNLLARLTLDASEVGTHSALQLRLGPDGRPSEIAYVGMLRDATGAWRFVDLSVLVKSTELAKPTGLGMAWNAAMVSRHTHVLTHDKDGGLGHLWVDGVEWMNLDEVAGLLDEVVHQPTSLLGGSLSVNPAPEDTPFWMLARAQSGAARMASDATIFGDSWGLLAKVPAGARRGWSHVHDRIQADGRREPLDEPLEVDRMPYSTRGFVFPLPTGQKVRITNQVVAVRARDGTREFGLRQVASVVDE
ncbi:MAG: hypothetical protein HY904_05300 [Deltaproteobacteria bacterium]|nr:hypothetical protein [Deltaproteobacteria bacterium]